MRQTSHESEQVVCGKCGDIWEPDCPACDGRSKIAAPVIGDKLSEDADDIIIASLRSKEGLFFLSHHEAFDMDESRKRSVWGVHRFDFDEGVNPDNGDLFTTYDKALGRLLNRAGMKGE